jgi:hypothetical protein
VEVTPQLRGARATKIKTARGKALRRIRGNANRNNPAGSKPAGKSAGPRLESPEVLAAATVAMVTVMDAGTPLDNSTDAGLIVQVEVGGAALQPSARGPTEPTDGVI